MGTVAADQILPCPVPRLVQLVVADSEINLYILFSLSFKPGSERSSVQPESNNLLGGLKGSGMALHSLEHKTLLMRTLKNCILLIEV